MVMIMNQTPLGLKIAFQFLPFQWLKTVSHQAHSIQNVFKWLYTYVAAAFHKTSIKEMFLLYVRR